MRPLHEFMGAAQSRLQAAIPAVLNAVCGLDVTAKVTTVDLGLAAGAADIHAPHLRRHRFADFMRQYEGSHVVRPEISRERQHALAFDLIAEDRNREQVRAERHLARMEKRSARDRETVPACLTPPASRSIGAAAIVNDCAAALWAERIAAIAGPADLAEDGLSFIVRQARDRR